MDYQIAILSMIGMSLTATSGLVYAKPSQPVVVGNFAIDRTEVTIAQFRRFSEATGLQTEAEKTGAGFEYAAGWQRRDGWSYQSPFGVAAHDDEPAVHITWSEAQRYCDAAGGRLPSYDEWRSAAYTEQRSSPSPAFENGRAYRYPVGDSPEGMNNNRERHLRVGTTKQGVNGLYDMGANAWEWVADRDGDRAMTAGGSWWYGPEQTRDGQAQWKAANFYVVYIGFRCAYDLPR